MVGVRLSITSRTDPELRCAHPEEVGSTQLSTGVHFEDSGLLVEFDLADTSYYFG